LQSIRTNTLLLILLLAILPSTGAFAASVVHRDTVRVYFRQGKSVFEPSFENNAANLKAAGGHISRADRVRILASASPEGSRKLNAELANKRAKSIAAYLHKNYDFEASRLQTRYTELDWVAFQTLVEEDESIPSRQKVLDIIETRDFLALRRLQGTKCWDYMYKNLYPSLRSTFVVFEYDIDIVAPAVPAISSPLEKWIPESLSAPQPLLDIFRPIPESISNVARAEIPDASISREFQEMEEAEPEYWRMRISDRFLKTNVLLYPLLLPSIGYEYRFANSISFSVLAYYSALDWFSNTTKFRVLGIQPEFRLWTKSQMLKSEWFFGLHGNFGWYNIAWNGKYRYQDHKQDTPAYGGGVSIGFKVPLFPKEDTRWGVEFSLGIGAMPLHYDIYYNVENGRLVGDDQAVYMGIDNASINLTYRIGRTEIKGRKRK